MARSSSSANLTPESEFLVAAEAIAISVLVGLTEISLVETAVAKTRAVVLCGFLVGSLALVAGVVALTVVSLALLVAFVVTGV
jgi:hypothetical protein